MTQHTLTLYSDYIVREYDTTHTDTIDVTIVSVLVRIEELSNFTLQLFFYYIQLKIGKKMAK